ncbi:T9SS type A sorting domain-containing protein [Halocola ammonii]
MNALYSRMSVMIFSLVLFFSISTPNKSQAQEPSVAKIWNETLLESIRNDFARPTVHARNLWHTSVVMYDAWAVYEPDHQPYFLGNTIGGFEVPFEGVAQPEDIEEAQREAISYAMYRLLLHRFQNAPNPIVIQNMVNDVMINEVGFDPGINGTDYVNGGPAELGNYIAEQMIAFGLQDGANEAGGYSNEYYEPVNDPLIMDEPGNPDITDPNRWQQLTLELAIDQSGNPVESTPPFLSPEWGNVVPFAMDEEDLTVYERDGNEYKVFHDPGAPPYLDTDNHSGIESPYKWGFALVAVWASHLDPTDGVMWDISPASIGGINIDSIPTDFANYPDFYDLLEGGEGSEGWDLNPKTGEPYDPQVVPRGDYARVLAEFWADGPDSETPPGHWFTILNYVNEQPELEKKWMGEGETLSDLEWDIKSYFTLGGAVHDVAISSWGVKGWYDYIRPVSAIRYMADQGQCTNMALDSYHPQGIPLIDGKIEVVEAGDPLAGDMDENVGKIKLYSWKGPDYIEDPEVDEAGVGWILAENWWPYQRPTFVTPPFAGYVSGHSTYSRASAEVLTFITGDPFFPGGMGEFEAPQNEFLVFEEGPSMDITLQWATYRDASDQCSLSRIWGGIHPPADDLNGRRMGETIGLESSNYANMIFNNQIPRVDEVVLTTDSISDEDSTSPFVIDLVYSEEMDTSVDPSFSFPADDPTENSLTFVSGTWTDNTTYSLEFDVSDTFEELMDITLQVNGAQNLEGENQEPLVMTNAFYLDTRNPMVQSLSTSQEVITDADLGTANFTISVSFDEEMDPGVLPEFVFVNGAANGTFVLNETESEWLDEFTFSAVFDIEDENVEAENASIQSISGIDHFGNEQIFFEESNVLTIDTKNPDVEFLSSNTYTILQENVGDSNFSIQAVFSEEMDTSTDATIGFPQEDPTSVISLNTDETGWLNAFTFVARYNVASSLAVIEDIDVNITGVQDLLGNPENEIQIPDYFTINMDTTSSVGEFDSPLAQVKIYPNPSATGNPIVVELPGGFNTETDLVLYTPQGKTVYSKEFRNQSGDLLIETEGLSAGLYFLQLRTKNNKKTFKVQITN